MPPISKIATALLVLVTATACTPDAAVPGPAVTTAAAVAQPVDSGDPLVDKAGVDSLLTRLSAANNKANAALDTGALPGFEAEAALEMDEASLKSRPKGDPIRAFTYNAVGSRIPGVLSGADFFVVEARTSLGGALYPLVMVRRGTAFALAHYVGLNAALPEIRQDRSGNALVVDDLDRDDTLIASPKDVVAAHARQIANKPDADPMFALDTTTSEVVNAEAIQGGMRFVSGASTVPAEWVTYSSTVSKYPIRALRTADGGAVVAYSTITEVLGTNPGKKVAIPAALRPLGTNTGSDNQTQTWQTMWWALVPAKGSGLPVGILGGTTVLTAVG